VLAEDGYSNRKYDRDTEHHGQGVSTNAGKPVSCLQTKHFFLNQNLFFRQLIAQFQREETQLFVLRVMVGLVILYDHVHPQGAFVKASNVDVCAQMRQL
jgi:CYRIA/CYRIB Rac1 binding domain